jgi:hypothetical protein
MKPTAFIRHDHKIRHVQTHGGEQSQVGRVVDQNDIEIVSGVVPHPIAIQQKTFFYIAFHQQTCQTGLFVCGFLAVIGHTVDRHVVVGVVDARRQFGVVLDDVIQRIGYVHAVQQDIGAVALTVIVDHQHPLAQLAQPVRQVDHRGRFAATALVVNHADDYTRHEKYHL